MSVFDMFSLTEYTIYKLKRGSIRGDVAISEVKGRGVFKERLGFSENNKSEVPSSDASLHVRYEDGNKASRLVGSGVVVDGKSYEVIACSRGVDYDTGVVEFFNLQLKRAEFTHD